MKRETVWGWIAKQTGSFRAQDLANWRGVSLATATGHLRRLADLGFVQHHGKTAKALWTVLKPLAVIPADGRTECLRPRVLKACEEMKTGITSPRIARKLRANLDKVSSALRKLTDAGNIKRVDRGTYEYVKAKSEVQARHDRKVDYSRYAPTALDLAWPEPAPACKPDISYSKLSQ